MKPICNFPKLAILWRELSWSHNKMIFALKSEEEREFYLRLTNKEKYSVHELERQINASVYERSILKNTKLSTISRVLPEGFENL